ncbi:hypothetical protein BC834DRAFT_966089 [Gloeopeniophorella convolvens]|nr:hypothetical protein BC834DRAFT_966089 [Gloeopeniophorella convolvens]
MDQSTPLTVATGTIASCKFVFLCLRGMRIFAYTASLTAITGALIAGTYALAKRRGRVVAGIYAASAALNCGVAGVTFFSIRGYAVTPLLNRTSSSRHEELEVPPQSLTATDGLLNAATTWWTLRTRGMVDSALSGGIMGCVHNLRRRGPRGAAGGILAGSIICTLGQVLYNEIGVQRIKYVSRGLSAAPSLPPLTAPVLVNPPEPEKPLFDRMINAIGLTKLSDDEYLAQMKKQRAACLRRIAELEAEAEADKDEDTQHS